MNYKKLYEMLPSGQANAISITDVAELWDRSERESRRIIEHMIYKDMIVCNLRKGYFVWETLDELESEQHFLNSYKCKLLKKEYRLRKAVEREHLRQTQYSMRLAL